MNDAAESEFVPYDGSVSGPKKAVRRLCRYSGCDDTALYHLGIGNFDGSRRETYLCEEHERRAQRDTGIRVFRSEIDV